MFYTFAFWKLLSLKTITAKSSFCPSTDDLLRFGFCVHSELRVPLNTTAWNIS